MIQIAIMGLGTVGTGVARVVEENAQQIQRKLGEPLQVKTVLVRHFHDGPYRHLMTDDFRKIEEDPDIRVVVETIGGVDAAYTYTRRALEAVTRASESLEAGITPDALLTDAEEALAALGELTGASVREDVTARIFERFCVGK